MNGTEHPALERGAEAEARPEDSIEIPETMLIRCPLVGHKMRSMAKHCPSCPSFAGLEDRFPESATMKISDRYLVLCFGGPTKRQMIEAE